jgi:predicted transcriptional regulator
MAEILLSCLQEKAKTSIMYKTNLNYAQLKSYLKFLTSQGFLTYSMNKYAITQKGYRFLDLFAQLNSILTR